MTLRHLDWHVPSLTEGDGRPQPLVSAADYGGGFRPKPARQRSARYSDQPMAWSTRLLGLGGVALIILLIILGGIVLTWRTYSASSVQPTISVFDVASSAARPELSSEVPPAPEREPGKKSVQRPEALPIEPPEIQHRSENAIARQDAQPTRDPGPPVEGTTAPEARSAPPAPQASSARPTWEGAVLAALNKAKRYPREASFRREQGVPWIRFVMDREGKVLSSRIERSSGFRSLDAEAAALPKRAAPFPKPPEEMLGDTIELVVPVEFFMAGW